MSKIHITFVGGQPAPVYHGIVATKPDKIIFICSIDTLDALRKIKDEITIPSEEVLLSPTDPVKIKQFAESLANKYRNDEVTLNISSGLKSWTYLFGITFYKMPNTEVVYMDQNNILWNYRTMKGTSDFIFDMRTLFRLYGNSIENSCTKFSDYTEKDKEAIKKIEAIRAFNNGDFNELTTILTKDTDFHIRNDINGKSTLLSGSYIEWEKSQHKKQSFVKICLYNKNNCSKEISIESPNAITLAFHAGWFEFKVAELLSTWDKVHEICLNCHFQYRKGFDKNETDIILNIGSKILFVECKTQVKNISDIDKFNSVVKGYGGLGSKALFVTDAPMKDYVKKKCKEYDILSFSLQDHHLGLSNEKAIQILLESELFKINSK